MALMKFRRDDPWKALEELHNEIDRLFDFSPLRKAASDIFAPLVDVSEDETNVYVEADLPGFEQKDVHLNLKGDTLTISAKKDEKKEEKKKNYYRLERTRGSFYREVLLPARVESSKVKAVYKNGVLKITLPKKEEDKGEEIKIDVA